MSAPRAPIGACWHPVGGSVRGSSHEASGRPNEDAWAATPPGDVVAAAVADGHGSERSPRSAVGSRLAVELAVGALDLAGRAAAEPAALEALLREQTGAWVVAQWRERVAAHAGAHPFTADELAAIGTAAPGQWETLRAYGCTLIALCGTPRAVGLLQLGDGDIVCVTAHGPTSLRPIPEDPANVAQFTSSLSQDDPLHSLRVAVVDTEQTPLALAFGSSDGFGTAYTDPTWWQEVGPQLAERVAALGPDAFAEKVPQWLAEPARVAGDDATMVVLLATGAGTPAHGNRRRPPAERVGFGLPPRDPRRGHSHRIKLAALTLAGVLLIVCLAAALILAGRDDDSPGPGAGNSSPAGQPCPGNEAPGVERYREVLEGEC